jgi:hypothetical protein
MMINEGGRVIFESRAEAINGGFSLVSEADSLHKCLGINAPLFEANVSGLG